MVQNDIQKLDRCLISGNPILFTGAGFSLGAYNDSEEEIPSGEDLKIQIIVDYLGINSNQADYSELVKASLSDVYTYASNIGSEFKLRDFVVEHLKGFHPKPYHETVLAYGNWSKVYTVNIDDVVENSSCGNRFVVQSSYRRIGYSKANKTEYIKLHGCVRNTDGRIVFSDKQYIDSMLHSTDYRFNSFAQDAQVENFVVLGTEMSEINLDYYIELFSSSIGKTSHGQLFFINPKPSLLFSARAQKMGAIVIPWTTEEFASHLAQLDQPCLLNRGVVHMKDFLDVRRRFINEKSVVNYKSKLYFGDYPCYKDIVFDWDFINPSINDLIDYVKNIHGKVGNRKMVALYGKALVGKSLYLKRIAVSLLEENFAVYEFCGKEFDIKYFAKNVGAIAEANIALIIDNASFYYREVAALMHCFHQNISKPLLTA